MNDITITISNYNGKEVTFMAPEDAKVDIMALESIGMDGEIEIIEAHVYLKGERIKKIEK